MDKTDTHSLENRVALFTEFNPNPIIGLNLSYEIIYLNLSARAEFPTILSVGLNHIVLFAAIQELKKLKPNGEGFILFYQDINFLDKIYEQQIFLIPDKDTIFIYMNDVTEKKRSKAEI